MTPRPYIRWATLAVALTASTAAYACGTNGSGSDPVRTGETTPEGEHCTADLPDGDCLTEEEGERGVDRMAEFVECRIADEVPDDQCPAPGDMP